MITTFNHVVYLFGISLKGIISAKLDFINDCVDIGAFEFWGRNLNILIVIHKYYFQLLCHHTHYVMLCILYAWMPALYPLHTYNIFTEFQLLEYLWSV
jgi:hypothetical protein